MYIIFKNLNCIKPDAHIPQKKVLSLATQCLEMVDKQQEIDKPNTKRTQREKNPT